MVNSTNLEEKKIIKTAFIIKNTNYNYRENLND